jgi:hypothetical protein
VVLWYAGVSVLLVLTVFRSAGVDYRLVAVGALLPLLVDVPFGRPAFGHSLAFSVLLLALAMLVSIGRPRLLRRRLLCVPVGAFCGLVLSGAWTDTEVLWWPTLGWSFAPGELLPAWWVVLLEEVAGLAAIWWVVGVCDLYLPGPRRELLRTGRLRARVEPEAER